MLLVPAPIKLRISVAVIPLAKEGVDPSVVIAGLSGTVILLVVAEVICP